MSQITDYFSKKEVVSDDSPAAKRPRFSVESQSSPEIEDTTTDADSSILLKLYEAIVATLETIKANADRSWNVDSTKKAVSHYHAIANFDFIVTLTVCQAVLAFTKGLTVKMQGTSSDILSVFSDIKDVVKTLSSVRQKGEENHAKWFQIACQIADKLDITVQKPRTCQVQRNRANNPAETVEDHYKRNLTIPLVDHLINELET
ncbi:52 kDa repressor of the inhibitor of the protein kinase [Stylophora pistillata]|uniref:52 kDa repressor of the inhibitor of the protein kinase n=1 Tax=Stylophora pistillata TaxID=50429 RepID=A0A2B4RBF9_STYPI|nr:52 kDa repressor of the inhibitor of the protein kinase [Stylophora pistillata]